MQRGVRKKISAFNKANDKMYNYNVAKNEDFYSILRHHIQLGKAKLEYNAPVKLRVLLDTKEVLLDDVLNFLEQVRIFTNIKAVDIVLSYSKQFAYSHWTITNYRYQSQNYINDYQDFIKLITKKLDFFFLKEKIDKVDYPQFQFIDDYKNKKIAWYSSKDIKTKLSTQKIKDLGSEKLSDLNKYSKNTFLEKFLAYVRKNKVAENQLPSKDQNYGWQHSKKETYTTDSLKTLQDLVSRHNNKSDNMDLFESSLEKIQNEDINKHWKSFSNVLNAPCIENITEKKFNRIIEGKMDDQVVETGGTTAYEFNW